MAIVLLWVIVVLLLCDVLLVALLVRAQRIRDRQRIVMRDHARSIDGMVMLDDYKHGRWSA